MRTRGGAVFIVDTDKNGDVHNCYSPEHDRYVIPPLAQLRPAPAELCSCLRGRRVRYSRAVKD